MQNKYKTNPGHRKYVLACSKKWARKNKERVNARNRAWRLKNPEKEKQRILKSKFDARKSKFGLDGWALNHERCVECKTTAIKHQAKGLCVNCYSKMHRKKPHIKKWSKEFSRRPHRRWMAKQYKRRVRGRGIITLQEWEDLKKKYNYTCPSCKVAEPKIKLVKDHIIPIALNGQNAITNIQPLCQPCNLKKGITKKKFGRNIEIGLYYSRF